MTLFVRPARRPSQRAALAWRGAAAGLALGLAALAPAAAVAAPTCLDSAAQTVRCDSPDALPAGAVPAVEAERPSGIPLPAPETLFGLVCVLGGLFVLIGLMPDFDGWGGEQDGRRRGD